jgi:hypothetical protein
MHGCMPFLLSYRSEGVVKDHHRIFCAQWLAAVVTHSDDFPALVVALGAFPAHYRIIPFH